MDSALRLPHSDPEHPLREAADYLWNDLSSEEKSAFEAHLSGCDRCAKAVALGRRALPVVEQLLREELPHQGADHFARFEAARAKLAAEGKIEKPAPWLVRRWGLLLAGFGALAAAAAAWLVFFASPAQLMVPTRAEPLSHPGKELAAPSVEDHHRPGEVSAPEVDHGHPAAPLPVPPPAPADVAVSVRVERPFLRRPALVVEAPRAVDDRYAAVLLVDSSNGLWWIRSGQWPDTACAEHCGPLKLRVSLEGLPAGPIAVLVLEGSKPIRDGSVKWFLEDHPGPSLPRIGERAAGRATFER